MPVELDEARVAGETAAAEAAGELILRGRAMATAILVRIARPGPGSEALGRRALGVFEAVERACTRFDPSSPLMRANSRPDQVHRVPPECALALRAAYAAYQATEGLFDPRVLRDLEALGYDRTLPFAGGEVETPRPPARRDPLPRWRLALRGQSRVVLGPHPVDLGGIGKGLAVRLASELLQGGGASDHLVEAGGDCFCAGRPEGAEAWMIGVEDPLGAREPLAVLRLGQRACATSSTRVRRWRAGGEVVHHLLEPATGLPGGGALAAVTVVAADPAWAEVWSKSLLVAGPSRIAALAATRRLAALWVDSAGRLDVSDEMVQHLCWLAPGAAS